MNKTKIEFIVGLFVIAGLICMGYLSIQLGGWSPLNDSSYTLKARFTSTAGLKEGSQVMLSGVPVGSIEKIELNYEDFDAIVTIRIPKKLQLEDDTIASVKTNGLIGDKYLSLSPGGSGIFLKENDLIIDTESAVDIEGLISNFAFGNAEE